MLSSYYGLDNDVNKADAPVLSTTTGVYNPVFGAAAFAQFNNEANVMAILPKYPWQKSGWRVLSADAGTVGAGGVAENGALPDTIKPTFAEISTRPKNVAHTFDVSYIQSGLVKKGDDAIGDMEFLRRYFAVRHVKDINKQLLTDADTLAGNNFESIDRVTFSTAARTALSYTAGDEDIYGIDRSANAWADAYVDQNGGTDRVLSMDLIRTALSTLETNGANTNVMLTGSDTKWRIIGLAEAHVRYNTVVGTADVRVGLNGVETEEGLNHGVRVATVYNVPLFVSQHVEKDTISRIYLLDTTVDADTGIPRLGLAMLYPTMYFESGMDARDANPFAINRFGTEGAYYTAGELICTFLAAQGSIRDLQ